MSNNIIIPTTPEQITADWLTKALRAGGVIEQGTAVSHLMTLPIDISLRGSFMCHCGQFAIRVVHLFQPLRVTRFLNVPRHPFHNQVI